MLMSDLFKLPINEDKVGKAILLIDGEIIITQPLKRDSRNNFTCNVWFPYNGEGIQAEVSITDELDITVTFPLQFNVTKEDKPIFKGHTELNNRYYWGSLILSETCETSWGFIAGYSMHFRGNRS